MSVADDLISNNEILISRKRPIKFAMEDFYHPVHSKRWQTLLISYFHTDKCMKQVPNECNLPVCIKMRPFCEHLRLCTNYAYARYKCSFNFCSAIKNILAHFNETGPCDCLVCTPLKKDLNSGKNFHFKHIRESSKNRCDICSFKNDINEKICLSCETPMPKKRRSAEPEYILKGYTEDEKFVPYSSEYSHFRNIKWLQKLSLNFKDLLLTSKYSDLTIKVKDQEFKVHRAILSARSTVFDEMICYGLSESNNNVIPIEDCEPAVFELLLQFVYTSKTKKLSSDTVFGLFYMADKYEIAELKKKCLTFIERSVTLDTVIDVFRLCLKHNETKVMEFAIFNFMRDLEKVLVTPKWELFLKENPSAANKLFLMALKTGYRKKIF